MVGLACAPMLRVSRVRCSYSADELFELTMIFHTRCGLNTATNVDRVGRYRRDRSSNIFRVQSTGENEEPRVAHRSPCSEQIAGLPRAASELGVVRIDGSIAFSERCCVFRLNRVSVESARITREIPEPVRCTIQTLYVHAIERIERRQFWRTREFLLYLHRRKRRRREFVPGARPQFRAR